RGETGYGFSAMSEGEASGRIFLLSPANLSGERAQSILHDGATAALGRQLREAGGATLADVMSFASGLYFRGKLAYARAFARPPTGWSGTLVITPSDGLRRPEDVVTLEKLRAYAKVDIHHADERYTAPLERDVRGLAGAIPADCDVVLL